MPVRVILLGLLGVAGVVWAERHGCLVASLAL